jgi:DNA-binding beta-propeller fold protein YncE
MPSAQVAPDASVPRFEWDPTWPNQPFPHDWIMGGGHGVAVAADDHIWVLHRAADLNQFEAAAAAVPPKAACCKPAPPVLEFDQAGNLLRSWGGPGDGYQWPKSPHGLTIDPKGNMWIGGNEPPDSQLLKFSPDGKFLLQIGRSGQGKGNADLANLGQPADTFVDGATNEVWVADGYKNRRVIVFDADTGAYKRHFGAYGRPPVDGAVPRFTPGPGVPPPSDFALVHCVKVAHDGLVYVCDRVHDRIQVFHKDGTFVKEKTLTPEIAGAVANDIAFSPDPDQRFMYVTDHATSKVWIVSRCDLAVRGSFGFAGHFGGGFTITHNIAADSKGNLYVTEGLEGKRVQRFLYKGLR